MNVVNPIMEQGKKITELIQREKNRKYALYTFFWLLLIGVAALPLDIAVAIWLLGSPTDLTSIFQVEVFLLLAVTNIIFLFSLIGLHRFSYSVFHKKNAQTELRKYYENQRRKQEKASMEEEMIRKVNIKSDFKTTESCLGIISIGIVQIAIGILIIFLVVKGVKFIWYF